MSMRQEKCKNVYKNINNERIKKGSKDYERNVIK